MSSPSCPVNLTFTLAPKSEKHNPALFPDREISPTSNGKLHSLSPCSSTSPSHTFPLFSPWRLSWYHCLSVCTQNCAGRHCHAGDSNAARPSAQHSTSVPSPHTWSLPQQGFAELHPYCSSSAPGPGPGQAFLQHPRSNLPLLSDQHCTRGKTCPVGQRGGWANPAIPPLQEQVRPWQAHSCGLGHSKATLIQTSGLGLL